MIRLFTVSLLLGAIATVIAVSVFFFYQKGKPAEAVQDTVTVQTSGLEEGSAAEQDAGTVSFSLFSDGYLYRSASETNSSAETAYEILEKPVSVVNDDVKGVSTVQAEGAAVTTLLPPRLSDQLTQTEVIGDEGSRGKREHIKFVQTIGGVKVFGSHLSVHVEDGTRVYAMTGKLIKEEEIIESVYSERQARTVALEKAASEAGPVPLKVQKVTKLLFNPSLVGSGTDTSTHPAWAVTVADSAQIPSFSRIYYISSADGTVLYEDNQIQTALNRNILDCVKTANCNSVRTEGSPPSGLADADSAYAHFGTVYTYFINTFGRDSYDGAGSILEAYVNLPDSLGSVFVCPNAAWLKSDHVMYLCPGLAVLDIVAHELTHGVNYAAVAFVSLNQSGALDEAISDMVAMTLDSDWTFAEDAVTGVMRRIDNPTANIPAMPDRLFDERYYCGLEDNGGVHVNMSVPTKAFHLMAEGGQFNGCGMTGIGKDKSMKIWYQALTRYLSFTSNFRDANNAVNQACADLYGAASAECTTTRTALQATEMDQQPIGSDPVTRCGGAVRRTPVCALPSIDTPTPSPTASPRCSEGDSDCSGGKPDLIDYEIWRREYLKLETTTKADFNGIGGVDLVDFELWRRAYLSA